MCGPLYSCRDRCHPGERSSDRSWARDSEAGEKWIEPRNIEEAKQRKLNDSTKEVRGNERRYFPWSTGCVDGVARHWDETQRSKSSVRGRHSRKVVWTGGLWSMHGNSKWLFPVDSWRCRFAVQERNPDSMCVLCRWQWKPWESVKTARREHTCRSAHPEYQQRLRSKHRKRRLLHTTASQNVSLENGLIYWKVKN